MATTKSVSESVDKVRPLELPSWQYDEFNQRMQDLLHQNNGEPAKKPSMYDCFLQNQTAALHFDFFARILAKFLGQHKGDSFDGIVFLQETESALISAWTKRVQSMEADHANGKFLRRACAMEVATMERALYGTNQGVKDASMSRLGSLEHHLLTLERCLQEDKTSRYWEIWYSTCNTLFSELRNTSKALQSLLQLQASNENSKVQEVAGESTRNGQPSTEQGGLRRRRRGSHDQRPSEESGQGSSELDLNDHTLAEAALLLAKALYATIQQIPFADLRDAFYKDKRAPTSLALVITSLSSIFLGVAVGKRRQRYYGGRQTVDHDFFIFLYQTIIQLFCLYIFLLPFFRGQQPHIKGVWFCTFIGGSVMLSIISLIVYVFSWYASTILAFAATLASMFATLLLVDGIDVGYTDRATKDLDNANGDV